MTPLGPLDIRVGMWLQSIDDPKLVMEVLSVDQPAGTALLRDPRDEDRYEICLGDAKDWRQA
ncbi:MAG: hypothetical protein HUU17_13910 [Chthonomonadales bacterium]|nr:hypothetical protein [Chthonomonadales bacterium]